MELRVLGALIALEADRELPLGGPQQRLLLALLAASIDRAVTVETLIDGLWHDDPPDTARKAVQVIVSNLRRELGDEPIKTAPGGYVLQSTAVDVDAVAFEREVAEALRESASDPVGARTRLESALGMWKGTPYADLGSADALRPEVARLNELRLRAVEARLDIDLALGRHAELLGELEILTAENPYREQLRALQMLALYRAGRQAEALRAYAKTRSLLAEELGIEPSKDLQGLEEQILLQAPELDADEQEDSGEQLAFLATDIEGSTELWESNVGTMETALELHDSILRAAVAAGEGRIFKTTGDGIFAVFPTRGGAVTAAVQAQQELHGTEWPTHEPIKVRMAVDAGAVQAREDDFFGPILNRLARVMASGHGGQLLTTDAFAKSVDAAGATLGDFDYKGIGRLGVTQLQTGTGDSEFAELRTDRTPPAMPRPGFAQAIRGYELRERLGEGDFGVVYRAYQASVGREVAIKVIRPDYANHPGFVKRFEAEAQFIAQLEHPHIVSLYDYWRDPDGAYLVMRFLRGGSVAQSLGRGPWTPPAAARILDQIGSALEHAHRHGIIHRDVKPANVLMDSEGNGYLTDFEIATRHVDAIGAPIARSKSYVTPEELAGRPVGPGVDIHHLGMLAFELLTGQPPAGRPDLAAVRPYLTPELEDVIQKATEPDPTDRYERVTDFVRAFRRALGIDVVSATPLATGDRGPVRNPFKGLRAFSEVDHQDFYGRDALIDAIVETVRTRTLAAVVGPSGSGKSSVVKAGLLPAIRSGVLQDDRDWLITEMFPGSYPFEELEAALLRVAVDRPAGLLDDLTNDERGLLRAVKRLLPSGETGLILVIDQFEELFSLTTDEETRRAFLANLVSVARDGRAQARIVVTIRADFFDRPLAYAEFGELMNQGLVPVTMPSEEGLALAISRPARGVGLDLEPGLVTTIVKDVTDQPGALPLMQYVLTEMVDADRDRLLTVQEYQESGGVLGALGRRAEEIYQSLGSAGHEAARQVFLRLVNVAEDADDTRRRVRRSELDTLEVDAAALSSVIDSYGSYRLLSFDRDPLTRGPTVEVAHEALIREWPRYVQWIDERREDLVMQRRLEAIVHDWLDADRDETYLLRGGRLHQFQSWMASGSALALSGDERAFLEASSQLEADEEHQTNTRRRRVLAGLSGLTVLLAVAAVLAFTQSQEAERNRYVAETQRLAAAAPQLVDSNRQVALLMAAEAFNRDPGPTGLSALQEVFVQTSGFVGLVADGGSAVDVAMTDSGELVVLQPETLAVVDPATGVERVSIPLGVSNARLVAVESSGRLAAVSGANSVQVVRLDQLGSAETWSVTTEATVTALAFDRAGGVLAVGEDSGLVTVHDANAGTATVTLMAHPEREALGIEVPPHEPLGASFGVRTLAFSDRGHLLATGGGIHGRVWDLSSGAQVHESELSRPDDNAGMNRVAAAARAVSFEANDQHLLAASSHSILEFEIGTATHLRELEFAQRAGGTGLDAIFSDVFLGDQWAALGTPGGRIALVSLDDGSAREFDAQVSGRLPNLAGSSSRLAYAGDDSIAVLSLVGEGPIVQGAQVARASEFTLSGDGRFLGVRRGGGTFILFENREGKLHQVPIEEHPFPFGYLGPRDGFTTWDGEIRTAHFRTYDSPDSPGRPLGQSGFIVSAYSPDGRWLALDACCDESLDEVVVLDLEEGGVVAGPLDDLVIEGFERDLYDLAFSHDSSRLFATTFDGAAVAWDTATWALATTLSSGGGQIVGLGFLPDGSAMVTLAADGTIRVRDPQTYEQIGDPLLGQTDSLAGFSFGPKFTADGRFMVTTADGQGRLWDLGERVQIGVAFPTVQGRLPGTSFDGFWHASHSPDGVLLWNIDVTTWRDAACQAAGRNLTSDEWQQFGPQGEPYQVTCDMWPSLEGTNDEGAGDAG